MEGEIIDLGYAAGGAEMCRGCGRRGGEGGGGALPGGGAPVRPRLPPGRPPGRPGRAASLVGQAHAAQRHPRPDLPGCSREVSTPDRLSRKEFRQPYE